MRRHLIAAAIVAFVASPAAADTKPSQTAPTHEECRSIMGAKMDGKAAHEHSADKTGAIYGGPRKRPLSEAEMRRMHEACAKKMAKSEPAKK